MVEAKPTVLKASNVAPRTATVYPVPYAAAVSGREKRALGDIFELSQFGVNLTTLQPGAWSSHRHWHDNEDEFIYVVDGVIVLIDDTGEHHLTPGMCAGFKAAVPNGHHLVNRSAKPATYLEVGTRAVNETAHYPEADMIFRKQDGKASVTRKDGSPY